MTPDSVDPIRLEVFRHLFASVAEEMGTVLRRTAFSPNIKERRDYSCALFGADAELVALAAHIPVHLGAMPLSVQHCVSGLAFEPGDVAIVNDPYRGGSHLPDITLVAPVFVGDGESDGPLGFVASRAHHADVGGSTPGSMGLVSELYQEGVIIPPLKLVGRGVLNEELRALLLANVRTPEERAGDLKAQLAAVRRGAERLSALASRYGTSDVARFMEALTDYAERMTRAFIAELPDGVYEFADAMDDDGVSDEPVEIRASVRIRGDEAEVDFEGTSEQRPSGVNAPYAVAVSAVYYVFRAVIAEQIPSNGGLMRPIRVVAPEGSLLNPLPPAAVALGNVETSQRITDVLLGALAQACPDRVPAASQGTMNNVTVGGRRPSDGQSYAYYETIGGGMGASPEVDGASATHSHMTNTLNTPIEALEYAYPLRVRRYEVRRGSGGSGRRRGGDGVRRDLELLGDARLCLMSDRRKTVPYGLAGGSPGRAGRNLLMRDGEEIELAGKVCLDVLAGDIISVRTPGGGGHGTDSPESEDGT